MRSTAAPSRWPREAFMQRVLVLALTGAATVLSVHLGAAQSARFELSNANVDLSVDSQGLLLRLANPQTGHSYSAAYPPRPVTATSHRPTMSFGSCTTAPRTLAS